jgi:hypothetical protein
MNRPRHTALVVIGLAIVAALVAWPITAEASRESITTYADARPVTCVGVPARVVDHGDNYLSSIPLSKAIDCLVRLHVHNSGLMPVSIDAASFPNLGPDSRIAFVDSADGVATSGAQGDAFMGVARLADRELGPGEDFVLEMHIVRARTTCQNGLGITISPGGWPVLTVTSLGIPGDRDTPRRLVEFTSTTSSFDGARCTG